MTFPIINYKFNNNEEAQALTAIVEQKLEALHKYLHGDESITCDVEFEKVAPKQNGEIYRFETNLLINGVLYRAEATEDSFEKALDEVRDELDKELRRAKSKQQTVDKKAGREAKEQLLG